MSAVVTLSLHSGSGIKSVFSYVLHWRADHWQKWKLVQVATGHKYLVLSGR